jgi:hypothetical protein
MLTLFETGGRNILNVRITVTNFEHVSHTLIKRNWRFLRKKIMISVPTVFVKLLRDQAYI